MPFDIEKLRKKALYYYESGRFYSDLLNNKEIFPLRYSFKKISQKEFIDSFKKIQNSLNLLKKYDSLIKYSTTSYKTIGSQKLPSSLYFKNIDEYLSFIDKTNEYQKFIQGFKKAKVLGLEEFLSKKPLILLKNLDGWERIILVIDFFLKYPKPNIYIRELPIEGVDTKFIQHHRKVIDTLLQEVLSEKFYNPSIVKLSNYGFEKKYGLKYPLNRIRFKTLKTKIESLEDIEISTKAFNSLELRADYVLIIENLTTFLAFPLYKNMLIIYGGGFRAANFKEIDLSFAKKIFYWGDIDTYGYAILSNLREVLPQIDSFLMDMDTLKRFIHLCVQEPVQSNSKLKNLTTKELEVFDALQNGDFKGLRLEQERIPMKYAANLISNIGVNI